MKKPPKTITVQVDTREKYPILFPATIEVFIDKWKSQRVKVVVEKKLLRIGDYRLKEYPDCCVIERKGSARELWSNMCTNDSVRAGKAFVKLMKGCQFPYLMLEVNPYTLWTSKGRFGNVQVEINPDEVLSKLCSVIARMKLRLLWFPKPTTAENRRRLGTIMLHLMLNHGLNCPESNTK